MNSRERFRRVLAYAAADRVPYFEEEIRQDVIDLWRLQGLTSRSELVRRFPSDRLVEIEPDLDPRPQPSKWPVSKAGLHDFRRLLNSEDHGRLPREWLESPVRRRAGDEVIFLYVHEGFFLSMGVDGWQRFEEVIGLVNDDPGFVREMMETQGAFAAGVAERVVREVEVDAAVFSEPIGGNHGPLISPRMYEELVLPSYEPLLDVLRRHCVDTIIFRTYANSRLLISSILRRGFNCLWACEVNTAAMDYRSLRREFGRDLRLIGGIDLDALRRGREAIRQEILGKVPVLLADGGFIPLADGRVREDVTFDNYCYYRRLLEEITAVERTSS